MSDERTTLTDEEREVLEGARSRQEFDREIETLIPDDDDRDEDDDEEADGETCSACGYPAGASGCRCDDDHEREAERARGNDFEETGGRDWT